LSWKKTPFVQGARVRGAGCDCETLIEAYLLGIGAAGDITTAVYSTDWFCHTTEEKYFNELSRYAKCKWEGRCIGTPPALPGDIAIFRTARSPVYNHGCIITGWPRSIHAFDHENGVSESRPGLHYLTAHRDMAIFDPWSLEC
jgi:cell wall-associated NlpC family hydrolase